MAVADQAIAIFVFAQLFSFANIGQIEGESCQSDRAGPTDHHPKLGSGPFCLLVFIPLPLTRFSWHASCQRLRVGRLLLSLIRSAGCELL